MKSFRFALFALATTIVLYACGGNTTSSADTGVSQAQVQSMIASAIAPLQQQIASLQQSSAPAVFITAPNAPAVKAALQRRSSQKATGGGTCTGLGTLTGRPLTSDPISSDDISGVSCSGYYYTISGAATASDTAIVQPLEGAVTVWFDGPNCTGNAYVELASQNPQQGISSGALANGAVFRVYANGANDPTDATSYWMLKPGTAKSDPMLMSSLQNQQCSAVSLSFDVYQLAQNDESVSGVPSAPIAGPVTID